MSIQQIPPLNIEPDDFQTKTQSMPFVHVFNRRVLTLFKFSMTVRPQFPLSGKYRSLLWGISDPRGKYYHQSCVKRGCGSLCPDGKTPRLFSGLASNGKTGALTSGRGSRYFFLTATI